MQVFRRNPPVTCLIPQTDGFHTQTTNKGPSGKHCFTGDII